MCILHFTDCMPDGYQTLDETTASLDPENEALVQKAIAKLDCAPFAYCG